MIAAISGNLVTADVVYEKANEGLIKGWDDEIQVVLETIYRFDRQS